MNNDINAFLDLSKILTGFENLNYSDAQDNYTRLLDSNSDDLLKTIKTFQAIVEKCGKDKPKIIEEVKDQIFDKLKTIAKKIIIIWYLSTTDKKVGSKTIHKFGTTKGYVNALLWKAIPQGHPLAYCGTYMGHWSFPPTVED